MIMMQVEAKLDGSVLDNASSVEKSGKIDTGGRKTRKKKVTEKMPGVFLVFIYIYKLG